MVCGREAIVCRAGRFCSARVGLESGSGLRAAVHFEPRPIRCADGACDGRWRYRVLQGSCWRVLELHGKGRRCRWTSSTDPDRAAVGFGWFRKFLVPPAFIPPIACNEIHYLWTTARRTACIQEFLMYVQGNFEFTCQNLMWIILTCGTVFSTI